ncbi:uncharacterized protein N7484_004186 [Penicillium longicatenatum]|uniref:uncharacterized protein n=1 Tax=Penicillium longicatenatum TaxID=1561947 RepID=UPI0025481CB9|nr:uncharacterized protein N7484_004186 [Penicillium longicatenatum]KAJ5650463.1 hypothetical protein N7484_004186 [Penicillium longicatenatum]
MEKIPTNSRFLLLLQFLDKTSLGYTALLGIRADTHLVGDEYSWINSIFYFGYFLWSFPTSCLIVRVPLGKYLAFVVVAWGAVLACHAACHNYAGFMVARFLLGIMESSVAPGFSFLTGKFYKREEQPLRYVYFQIRSLCIQVTIKLDMEFGIWYVFEMAQWHLKITHTLEQGNSFAGLIGGVLAYGIGHINAKLYSWQYLFIILCSATSACGIALFWLLPDGPDTAWFLSPMERVTAVERTKDAYQTTGSKEFQMYQVWEALKDPQSWLLSLNMLGCMLVNSGLSAFTGIIIAGFGYAGLQALLYQMPASAVQIGLVLITSLCGSYIPNCRCIMLAILSLISIIGVLLVYLLDDSHTQAKLFGASIMGAFACILPISMSTVSSNISGSAKKTTVSAMLFLSYCIGNIINPQVFLTREEPKYPTGIKVCLTGLSLGFVSAVGLRFYLQHCNTLAKVSYEPEGSEVVDQYQDRTDREIPGFIYLL